mgnify:CR=1 FL=1
MRVLIVEVGLLIGLLVVLIWMLDVFADDLPKGEKGGSCKKD